MAVKMPQFKRDDPDMWLFLVERSISLSGIVNEDTKFCYVVTSLEPCIVHEVRDIVLRSPPNTPYTTLKNALINRLSVSQEQKNASLVRKRKKEKGDSKPSQFL